MLRSFTKIQESKFEFEQDVQHYQSVDIEIWKRLFDIIVAGLVTISILIWLMPVIGLLIKLTSPGPIIFVQWRTGINGRPFQCFKFRTMKNTKQSTAFKQTVFNDPRITPIGSWLRKTNLDEMPQFLNVLMGTMSVVGPRPHALQHDAEFWSQLSDYHRRYTVLPGITGLAQICGARGITDDIKKMNQRLEYDLLYIEKSSFWLDAKICLWTLRLTLFGDSNAW